MKTKIALIFTVAIMLQACGSKGRMMHSEVSIDQVNIEMIATMKS